MRLAMIDRYKRTGMSAEMMRTGLAHSLVNHVKLRDDSFLTEDDLQVLRGFSKNKHQTLGDLLTFNMLDGAKIMSSVQKLVSFGFLRRDWEKELQLKSDVIYTITHEGNEVAT